VVDAPSVSLAIAVAVVVVCKNVPELTLSAKANGMSWRMNDVLDASGTAVVVGVGVETGVDAELESELDAIGATSIGGRSGVVAFEEVSAPAETEVVVAVAAVAVDDEVVDDADVIDAVSIVVDVAALDVGASPICHTNVSPTFVICPDVAKDGGKNPPQ
jgi:protein-disulfide isomerase